MVNRPEPSTPEANFEGFDGACAAACELADRLKEREAQVRGGFVYRSTGSGALPPASHLHRAKGKDSVALKLELSLLWAAGGGGADPRTGDLHNVRFDARDWAELLGLAHPDENGKRRIRDALQRLESHQLIERTAVAGQPTIVKIRNDTGTGAAYRRPGDKGSDGNYFKLPPSFWTNGWLAQLSGTAIIVLLAILYLDSISRSKGDALFASPQYRHDHFGFSQDTWYDGLKELRGHHILAHTKQPVRKRFSPDHTHSRDAYFLETARFRVKPGTKTDAISVLLAQDAIAQATANRIRKG